MNKYLILALLLINAALAGNSAPGKRGGQEGHGDGGVIAMAHQEIKSMANAFAATLAPTTVANEMQRIIASIDFETNLYQPESPESCSILHADEEYGDELGFTLPLKQTQALFFVGDLVLCSDTRVIKINESMWSTRSLSDKKRLVYSAFLILVYGERATDKANKSESIRKAFSSLSK